MRHSATLVLAATFLSVLTLRADARTWTIEKDGTGDTTVIQDAIDAAAPGDTILVGVGRWTDFAVYQFRDGDPAQGIAAIDKGPLCVRGVDREGVQIGPTSPTIEFDGLPTFSIGIDKELPRIVLENLTIRGTKFPLLAVSTLTLRNCTLLGGNPAAMIGQTDGAVVENCRFEAATGTGLALQPGGMGNRNTLVQGCEFVGNGIGLNAGGTVDLLVDRCRFVSNTAGVSVWFGGAASVTKCTFTGNGGTDLSVTEAGVHVELTSSTFDGGANTTLFVNGILTGHRNHVGGGWENTVYAVGGGAYVSLSDGDVLNGGGQTVFLTLTTDGGLGAFDMRNNYWGTEDTAQIDEWIHDGVDSPPNNIVEYDPVRLTPLSSPRSSFGGLKARYGGRN